MSSLLYCRAGFEKELAAELDDIAAEAGLIGYVRAEPDSIDAPWMTAALESAGVARGATVTGVVLDGLIGLTMFVPMLQVSVPWPSLSTAAHSLAASL